MVESIEAQVKRFGLFKVIQLLHGINRLREIVVNYPQLKYLLDELKGSCSVSYNNLNSYPDAYFDFHILDVDIMDEQFAELIVDMVVDFTNLSGEEIYNLKQWFGAVADDHGFDIYDVGLKIPTHQNLYIKSFNGKPYSWPGYDDIISEEEAFELLDKTGKWDGMIREEKSLRNTVKTILKEESDKKEKNKESFNQKVRYAVENIGLFLTIDSFAGNLDIIKQAYQDNPSSYLNQFKKLNPDKKGDAIFYRDEKGKPLFVHYKDDDYLGVDIVNVDNDRIWAFFYEVLGYDYDEVQSLLKVWLSEVYGLDNVRPLRAHQISDY